MGKVKKSAVLLFCLIIIAGTLSSRKNLWIITQWSEKRPIFPELSLKNTFFYTKANRPASEEKGNDQFKLEEILNKSAEYCDKVENSALFYICREKIYENIAIKPGSINMKYNSPPLKDINRYIYDYQLIKKGNDIRESRTLLEENREIRNEKDAPLKTKIFYSKRPVFGPVGLLGKESQESYFYRFIKDGKIEGREVYVIEAIPKRKMEEKPNYGKLWVDKEDFSILKIEIEQESLAGYQHVVNALKKQGITPTFKTVHFFKVEKNGVRFPSKTVFKETWKGLPLGGKPLVKSFTEFTYDDYKFFTVETEVEIKKEF